MSDDDLIEFAAEADADAAPPPRWKVAIIDDDRAVHEGTRFALHDYQLDGHGIDLLSAYSAADGRRLLAEHPDIAVILLDVVMETDNAGLGLAQVIRRELGNDLVRIVLRTGQPGQAPERRVIVDYDINDYKAKTELTADRLFATLTVALRSFEQLRRLADLAGALRRANETLESRVAERTASLKRVNDFKNVMLGMVAHELKNPLGVILGRGEIIEELLKMVPPPLERLPDQLERMVEPARRMLGMIDTLMTQAMEDGDEITLHPVDADLGRIVSEVVAANAAAAAAKDQEIRLEGVPQLAMVLDIDRMREAVDNLVSNAIKYAPRGGHITVRLERGQAAARLVVSDDGQGLSPEDHSRLFGRFQRLSAKPTGGEGSTGLGLSITKHIVTLHGGTLGATSAGPGKGAAFTIQLPILRTEDTGG